MKGAGKDNLPPISDGCAVCGGKEGPLYWSWRFR